MCFHHVEIRQFVPMIKSKLFSFVDAVLAQFHNDSFVKYFQESSESFSHNYGTPFSGILMESILKLIFCLSLKSFSVRKNFLCVLATVLIAQEENVVIITTSRWGRRSNTRFNFTIFYNNSC